MDLYQIFSSATTAIFCKFARGFLIFPAQSGDFFEKMADFCWFAAKK